MARYGTLSFLAGFLLLVTTACSGYGPGYTAPPPEPYDEPPRYDDAPRYDSTEQRIHDRVHRALERAPALRDVHIGVHVKHRNVYLSGTVYSYDQKHAAHEVAHSVEGVRRVFTRDIRVRH